MDNTINFKGAFLIKKTSPEVKRNLINSFEKKGKFVYDNFKNTNDLFLVVRDEKDKFVADFINKHNITNFKYFPSLNTSSGFHYNKPEEADKIIKEKKPKYIKTINTLIKYFKNLGVDLNESDKKYINETLKAVNIKPKEHRIENNAGYYIVKDKNNTTVARISPKNKYGINFIHVIPKCTDHSPIRYSVKDGIKLAKFEKPDEVKAFLDSFDKAVKYNIQ